MNTVCFVITTFNREELLQIAIDSVLPELDEGDSLLVVDDASSDGTEVLMKKLTERHDKVHYYRMPKNSGVNQVRQQAIIEVGRLGTRWLSFIDDDDILVSGIRKHFSSVLESMPEQSWVAFPSVDSSGNKLSKFPSAGDYSYIEDYMGRRIIRGDFQHFITLEVASQCSFAIQFKNAEEWYFWCQISKVSSWYIDSFSGVVKQYLPEGLSKSGYNQDKKLQVAQLKVDMLQGAMSSKQLAKQFRNLGKAYLRVKSPKKARVAFQRSVILNPLLLSSYKYWLISLAL